MMNAARRIAGRARDTAVLLGAAALLLSSAAEAGLRPDDDELHRWRAERRADVKASSLSPDKSSRGFGLLVIPVDFSDTRLPAGWSPAADLSPRVNGLGGETLERYFTVASGEGGWLRILTSPLIHMTEEAAYYSDLDLNGFTRTRALALEAITGAAAAGTPFDLADCDGDDGVPGSGDDDGYVDGVLILHAAPGLENDPENGRIVPLQFYLEEPYVHDGIAAQHYAVASLQSGVGVWSHETGHLLGLEDRYDLTLSPGADSALSRGGLGAFSLMSAGAWGRGDGTGAALLDAYSAVQLGWAQALELTGKSAGPRTLRNHEVWKLPAGPANPDEYFLMEVRGGDGDAPFDALLPEPQLLIYHVDASVPDDAFSPGADGHLRVRLVEADGDDDVAAGETSGDLSDVFPGELGVAAWNDTTLPSSDGYFGGSGISCVFNPVEDGVEVDYVVSGHGLRLRLRTEIAAGDTLIVLDIRNCGTVGIGALSVNLFLDGPGPHWGDFKPGVTAIHRSLQRGDDGVWSPTEPVVWRPDPTTTPSGAKTFFIVELIRDGETVGHEERTWLWEQADNPLDFSWSDAWTTVSLGDAQTVWHLWPGATADGLPDVPVMACTGVEFEDGSAWPEVTYHNSADAVLQSPPFHTDDVFVRMIHTLDAQTWEPGRGPDGGVVTVRLDDGSYCGLSPLGGYPGIVDSAADNALLGLNAYMGAGELADDGAPLWRLDLFPLPADVNGWTDLQLRFASDPLWRARGWLLARLDLVPADDLAQPFAARWVPERGGLELNWPWEDPQWITVEISPDNGGTWSTVWEGGVPTGQDPAEMLIPARQMQLPPDAVTGRALLRARLRIDLGEVVSKAGVLDPREALSAVELRLPCPNPAWGEIGFLARSDKLPSRLGIYDLRGRIVREWLLEPGAYQIIWDGRDDQGRFASAGVYLIRLTPQPDGPAHVRKVTLLR